MTNLKSRNSNILDSMDRQSLEEILELLREIRACYVELKYNADQPRVPAGNSNGGQWVRFGGIATPNTLEDQLDHWGEDYADGTIFFQVAAADIPKLTDTVLDWLGPGAFQQNSPNGAIQFFSSDRLRLIRFDISPSTSHGRNPHINVEPGRRHIYLR